MIHWSHTQDMGKSTSLILKIPKNCNETDEDHQHLDEICDRYRDHTASIRIDEDNEHTDEHTVHLRNRSSCHCLEYDSKCYKLCCNPPKIRKCDNEWTDNLYKSPIPFSIIVTDREMMEWIEFLRKEDSNKDKAQCCTKRIGDHSEKPMIEHLSSRCNNRLRAEPSRKSSRDNDRKWEAPPCKDKIRRSLHTTCNIEADEKIDSKISNDEEEKRSRKRGKTHSKKWVAKLSYSSGFWKIANK